MLTILLSVWVGWGLLLSIAVLSMWSNVYSDMTKGNEKITQIDEKIVQVVAVLICLLLGVPITIIGLIQMLVK